MRSCVYSYIVMACTLSSLVSCHKPQEQTVVNVQPPQEAIESSIAEVVQEIKEKGPTTLAVADNGQTPKVANESTSAEVVQGVKAKGVSTCGPTTLDDADADKWECVPEVGHWCTDPKGCPVKGNIASVGTHLAFAQPLPQGIGYQFSEDRPYLLLPECDRNNNSGICNASIARWSCTLSEGCDCGAGKVKKSGKCIGDTYKVDDSIPSETCNKDKCGAYCKNNQCVCGEKILTENKDEYQCEQNISICTKQEGCAVDGQNYAYYQTWINYIYEDASQIAAQQANDAKQASEKAKAIVVPEGYILTNHDVLGENVLECSVEEGCPCGAQICPKDFICQQNRCVTAYEPGDAPGLIAYYCDEACSCSGSTCPKNAFCRIEDGVRGWTNSSTVRCESFKEVTDAQTAFEFWKEWDANMYVEDDETKPHVIFDKTYWGERENGDANYYLNTKDGKQVNMYVVCSKTGCNCNGSPLNKDYYCIQQHVVFASGEEDSWNTCRAPYQPFTYDMEYVDVSCDISENIVEQVCFRSKGCTCGSTTIAKGDVCVNGQAQCSTLHSRPGCLCGDKTLEKGYGCYKGSLMCQSQTCKCRDTDIHYGDICAEDKVICGMDSSTPGCICAGEALKKGYRCFEKKQLCDCTDSQDNEGTDENECKCKCGKSEIAKDEECKNNKPVPMPKAETIENENGDILLKCGNEMVNIGNGSIRYDNGNKIDIDRPEDRAYVCTCGTGKKAPGEGYGCAFSTTAIGPGSEWMRVNNLAGWMCLNMEGCKCGDSICYPDDLCLGSDQCDEFNTFKLKDGRLTCEGHDLPADVIMKGYGCYYDDVKFLNASGWYCGKPEGCPCGEATCEQYQMCLEPGHCGEHKLNEQVQQNLEFLQIKRVECNDFC